MDGYAGRSERARDLHRDKNQIGTSVLTEMHILQQARMTLCSKCPRVNSQGIIALVQCFVIDRS